MLQRRSPHYEGEIGSSVLGAGDHVLVTDNVYRPSRNFCNGMLARYGVEVSYFDPLIGAGIAEELAGIPWRTGDIDRAAEALARWPELPADALAMISSPADVRSLRPRPWKPDAVRQVRLRHALKMPRLAGRPLFRPKPSAAEAVSRITIPKLIVSSRGDWLVDPEQGRILARGAGCTACGGTGYRGRVGLFEVLAMSEPIRALIADRASTAAIQRQAVQEGMRTLRQDGIRLCLEGVTTATEVRRVAGDWN